MPRGKKRQDPADAPIDGDYSLDQVVNKDPAFKYAMLHAEDMPKYRSLGYVPEERGPDAAKPRWDSSTETDAGYKVRDLTLMKIPRSLAERIDGQALGVAKRRTETLKREFTQAGGQFAVPQNNF